MPLPTGFTFEFEYDCGHHSEITVYLDNVTESPYSIIDTLRANTVQIFPDTNLQCMQCIMRSMPTACFGFRYEYTGCEHWSLHRHTHHPCLGAGPEIPPDPDNCPVVLREHPCIACLMLRVRDEKAQSGRREVGIRTATSPILAVVMNTLPIPERVVTPFIVEPIMPAVRGQMTVARLCVIGTQGIRRPVRTVTRYGPDIATYAGADSPPPPDRDHHLHQATLDYLTAMVSPGLALAWLRNLSLS